MGWRRTRRAGPRQALLAVLALALGVFPAPGLRADTVCTVIAATDGRILLEDGDCATRVTPASTFKIPLALMGFDAGVLIDAHSPALPFREGYPAWGGAPWMQETDPAHWMRHSVLWYSQAIARDLGTERLARYAADFGYGNADFTGDPGRGNGLERAWIASSLLISPVEQVRFLARLVRGELPATPQAQAATRGIVARIDHPDGWTIHGKTGSAYPRQADGSFDRTRGWGWFVGWAERGGTTLVFARLAQDRRREEGPGGLRARAALLADWAALTAAIGLD